MALIKQSDTILYNALEANYKIAYAGVRVQAYDGDGIEQQLYSDASGTPTSLVQTDTNGAYTFWIEEGDYELRFSVDGQPLGATEYSLWSAARAADLASTATDKGADLVGFSQAALYAQATVGGKLKRFIFVTDAPFNAKGDGVNDDTGEIQAAIDYVYAAGGGVVALPQGSYKVSASTLSETYDNAGVAVPASACAIVQRAGVSIVGIGGRKSRIFTTDNTLNVIAQIAPIGCELRNLEIHAEWDSGEAGAGHGVLVLSTTGGADTSCRDNLWSNLYIHNVASYGIGLQSGAPTRCRIEDIDIANIGADGLDLKARSDVSTEPNGNTVNNVTIRNHGQRVTGSAGVDIRGIWQVSKITVTDFGGNDAFDYLGVRFRTKPPVGDAYNKAAARSTGSEIYVRPTIGATATTIIGVQNGSDDVTISNVVTEDCTYGYSATGNVNGNSQRATIIGFVAISSRVYGLYIGAGCTDQTLIGCHTRSSTTAGIRNEGDRTTIVGHHSSSDTAQISTSGGASPTEIIAGGSLGAGGEYGLTMTSSAAGRVGLDARGPSTNIDITLSPKGTGVLRFGTLTANADAPITGYITVKDSAGTTRKLAVIA